MTSDMIDRLWISAISTRSLLSDYSTVCVNKQGSRRRRFRLCPLLHSNTTQVQALAMLAWTTCIGAVHKVRHAIFGPSVTLCHTSRDPPKVRHTSRNPPPPIFSRPSTKNPDKSPLAVQILSQLLTVVFVRGFCSGVLSRRFVRSGFSPFPFWQNTSVTTES